MDRDTALYTEATYLSANSHDSLPVVIKASTLQISWLSSCLCLLGLDVFMPSLLFVPWTLRTHLFSRDTFVIMNLTYVVYVCLKCYSRTVDGKYTGRELSFSRTVRQGLSCKSIKICVTKDISFSISAYSHWPCSLYAQSNVF